MEDEAYGLEDGGRNVPLVGKIGGVRVTSSSLLRADRMGCPWALRAGVDDIFVWQNVRWLQAPGSVVG